MDPRSYVEEHASAFFEDLKEWLAIPSISADPARRDDVRRSAEWLAAHLRATGFPRAPRLGNRPAPAPPPPAPRRAPASRVPEVGAPARADPPGPPAVSAEGPAADPAAPTVLIYGHHDV